MALQAPICFTVMEIVPNAEDRHFRTRPLRATPGETIAHLRKMSAESFNKSSTDIQLVYYGECYRRPIGLNCMDNLREIDLRDETV